MFVQWSMCYVEFEFECCMSNCLFLRWRSRYCRTGSTGCITHRG